MQASSQGVRSLLPALVIGQTGLHTAMAGVRLAMSLQALQQGHSAWAVGVLLALFAALPVLTALPSGRMTDRHGYHRPLAWAVSAQMAACTLAVAACWVAGPAQLLVLCVAASVSGASANMGMITIQRTAGRLAGDTTQRLRVFSWLGVAPSLANMIGPVAVGLVIDGAGFAAAYGLMLFCPLLTLLTARQVPRETGKAVVPAAPVGGQTTRDLLRLPAMKRLMGVNWLLSTSWDVHAFAVPVMGHGLSFTASTIGLILGAFTLSVTLVRVVVPALAHRLRQAAVLRAAMVWTGAVLAVYPWATSPWAMGTLAVLLGVSLGVVQPIIMTNLHRLTPDHRHGEAIALRSMVINASSSVMPLTFGAIGTALGPAVLFWAVAALVTGGNVMARRLEGTPHQGAGASPTAP